MTEKLTKVLFSDGWSCKLLCKSDSHVAFVLHDELIRLILRVLSEQRHTHLCDNGWFSIVVA